MPAVSIVIPVYNAEKWLDRTVACVLNQTLQDWELILVNDSSSDGSADICERYAQQDERIRVFHQGRSGPGIARNLGKKKATGDYIGFMDADDYILPRMYELMYDKALLMEADVVKCGVHRVAEGDFPEGAPATDDELPESEGRWAFVEGIVDERGFVQNLAGGRRDGSVCNLLVKKNLCKSIQFSDQFCEDALFNLELAGKAEMIYVLRDVLYVWILREDALSAATEEKKNLERAYYNRRLFKVCDRLGDMEDEKTYLYNLVFSLTETLSVEAFGTKNPGVVRMLNANSVFLDENRQYLDEDWMAEFDGELEEEEDEQP